MQFDEDILYVPIINNHNVSLFICSCFLLPLHSPSIGRNRRDANPAELNENRQYGTTFRNIDHPRPTIRIDGLRVETSDKSVEYTDENIPEFFSSTKATLRLFGSGFTENMMIAFTEEAIERGGVCEGSSGGKYPVRKDGLRDHTALVDIVVPIASKTPYFICAKNKDPPMSEMVSAFHAYIYMWNIYNYLCRYRTKF